MPKVKARFKHKGPRHRIRQWRKSRNLTLEQLSERIGVTPAAIGQLERGEVHYTQPMLEALADELGCTPADLIMRDPNSKVWSLAESLEGIGEADQRRIISMIDAFKKTG